ncbi:MAG: ribose transport system permease protein [Gaiellales bacterium]|nr:ribose transport system permease protein [Gaiellales bacterium]
MSDGTAGEMGAPLPAPARARRVRKQIRSVVGSRVGGLVLLDLVFIALVGSYNSDFVRIENFRVILDNMGLDAVVMVGTVLLLAGGRFDLSIDGVAALSGIVTGKLLVDTGLATVPAVAAGLATGLAVGLINGVLIERAGLNPLMTTLATWWATTGIALGLTQGYSPFGFPGAFTQIGQATFFGSMIAVYYATVVVVVAAAALAFTRFGYHIFATGGDREAARLNGIRVDRIGILLYMFAGLLSAIAGLVFAARLSTASPVAFDGLALDVIAAAVIGGASLNGGRGSIVGGLLGLLLLNMLGNAAIYVGISPYWQKAISGAVLLVAVSGDVLAERVQRSEWRPWRRGAAPQA